MIKGWVFDNRESAADFCQYIHDLLVNNDVDYDADSYCLPLKHHDADLWFVQYVEQYSSALPSHTDEITKSDWFPEITDKFTRSAATPKPKRKPLLKRLWKWITLR